MRLGLARQDDTLLDLFLDIARTVVAALGVEAEKIGERPADASHVLGKTEQFEKAPVAGHQAQLTVENAETLRQILKSADDQINAACFLSLAWRHACSF
jgi:hypothetical protein